MDGWMKKANQFMKTTELGTVLEKQKALQEHLVKLNPCHNNASLALLKWSMSEGNLSLFDAFSSWADLDFALLQLTQAVIDQNIKFRRTFKNIQVEEKRLSDIQKEKETSTKKVNSICGKIDTTKKGKKVDQVKIDNLKAELTLATGKEKEMASLLENKAIEFEQYKAEKIKEILIEHSKVYVDFCKKGLKIWEIKEQIANDMAAEALYSGEHLQTDAHNKVRKIFSELSMELPPRGELEFDHSKKSLSSKFMSSGSTLPRLFSEEGATLSTKGSPKPQPKSQRSNSEQINGTQYTWMASSVKNSNENSISEEAEESDSDHDYAFPEDHGDVYLVPTRTEEDDLPSSPSSIKSPDYLVMQETDGPKLPPRPGSGKSGIQGVKVLPSGGTMKAKSPVLKDSDSSFNILSPQPVQRQFRKVPTPPPDVDEDDLYINSDTDGVPDKKERDQAQFGPRKPAISPKPKKNVGPPTKPVPAPPPNRKISTDVTVTPVIPPTKEAEDDYDSAYTDVALEGDYDCPELPPNHPLSQKTDKDVDNNSVGATEEDSDEDYENVALSDL